MAENQPKLADENNPPTDKVIYDFIGDKPTKAWKEIVSFLKQNYNFEPELKYYGKKYGWCIRYRRSNKTLCALYPEKGYFQIQIVLGKAEVEKADERKHEFHPNIQEYYNSRELLHDGKWLFLEIKDGEYLEDVKRLLEIKKSPKKK